MTNSKLTKRSLFASSISLLLCFTMLLGTTFAWFTDSVTSANNIITAGNLDVELYHSNRAVPETAVDENTELFDEVDLWEPGAMVWEKLTVKNAGSLALKYTLSLNVTDISNVNGKSLADVLKVAILNEQPSRENVPGAATKDLATFNLDSGKELLSGASDSFYVAIYWAPSANDNDYNVPGEALNAKIGVNLVATQKNYEQDSFGPDYDEFADGTVVTPANFEEVMNAAQPGDILYLDYGMYGDLVIENADGTAKDGITIVGREGNASNCVVESININSSTNITLKDIRFDIAGAEAVYKKDGGASGYVSNIIGAKSGAAKGAMNVVIDNCTFKTSNSYDASIYVPISFEEVGRPTSRATNITIRNCKTDPMKNMLNFARLNYMSQGTVTIENNTLLATCQHNAFNFTGNAANLIIRGNSIGWTDTFDSPIAKANGWNPAKSAIGTSRQGSNHINIQVTGNTFAMKDALVAGEGVVLDVKTNTYTKDNCTVDFSGNTFVGSLAGMTEADVPCVMPQ